MSRDLCACHGLPTAPDGKRRTCREKKRARQRRYDQTAAGIRRKIKYDIEIRGRDPVWIEDGPRGGHLREREEYEASGSDLSFLDWLNEVHPLPKLVMR